MNVHTARRARRIAYAIRTRQYAYIPFRLISDPQWRETHILEPHVRTTQRLARELREGNA